MNFRRLVSAVAALAVAGTCVVTSGVSVLADDDAYDEYGIGEVVFGTDNGDGTVSEETFDDYNTPSENTGWSGTFENVSIVSDKFIAAGDMNADGSTANVLISGAALQYGYTGEPIKKFSNEVSNGIVKFSASYYMGTRLKAVELRDSDGNDIIYLGHGQSTNNSVYTSIITAGNKTVSAQLYSPRSRATRIYDVEIDLDKGTITFSTEHGARASVSGYASTQSIATTEENLSTTFDNANIADIIFSYDETQEYASTDTLGLVDNISLYAYMPTTRHAITVNVVDENNDPVADATVSVTDYRSVTTDNDGTATIYLDESESAYTVTAEADGYEDGSGTVSSDENAEITVTVQKVTDTTLYPVTFNVINKATSESVSDTTIVVTDKNDAEVTYTDGLNYGTYSYTVAADGYKSVSGSFTIESDPDNVQTTTVDVELYPVAVSGTITYTDGSNEIGSQTLDVSGLYYEDSVVYGVPKYIIYDSKLYRYGEESGQQYTATVSVSGENSQADATVEYTDITSDGEIPAYFCDFGTGVDSTTTSAEYLRCSGGNTATTNGDFTLILADTLEDGVYTIEIGHYKNRAPYLYVGDTEIQTLNTFNNSGTYGTTTVTGIEITSGEAVIVKPNTDKSSYVDNMDYVLAIKTGDLTPSITAVQSDTVEGYTAPTIADTDTVKSAADNSETTYEAVKNSATSTDVTTFYVKINNASSDTNIRPVVTINGEKQDSVWTAANGSDIYFGQLIGDINDFATVMISYDGAADYYLIGSADTSSTDSE